MSEKYDRGDRVEKYAGDSYFAGTVIARLVKLDGLTVRYAVEDGRGIIMIYSPSQLRRVPKEAP